MSVTFSPLLVLYPGGCGLGMEFMSLQLQYQSSYKLMWLINWTNQIQALMSYDGVDLVTTVKVPQVQY